MTVIKATFNQPRFLPTLFRSFIIFPFEPVINIFPNTLKV